MKRPARRQRFRDRRSANGFREFAAGAGRKSTGSGRSAPAGADPGGAPRPFGLARDFGLAVGRAPVGAAPPLPE